MCGIAGFYRWPGEDARQLVEAMCQQLVHRGPDDAGYHVESDVALGMRRLSIIDVDGGAQPVATADKRQWMVYNGEVYNHQQLRKEMQLTGEEFRSQSDTEVVLKQIERHGVPALHSFNGMFALAHWDSREQTLLLARDRVGIKPLYYYWDGRHFAFASEIKALLSLPGIARKLDQQALWDYLTYRYVPEPGSIWQHIHKLPPGHTLHIGQHHAAPLVTPYWSCSYTDVRPQLDRDECAGEFETLFIDAVQKRLLADVPVGILLSGGLDSSAVTAAACSLRESRIDTFSVGFSGDRLTTELQHARSVANHLGTRHNQVEIGQREFMDYLPRFVRDTDEPLADLASVPLFYVARLASDSVKVLLSGEGSDEILGGYDYDQAARTLARLALLHKMPRWLRESVPCAVLQKTGASKMLERVRRANMPIATRNAQLLPSMTAHFTELEKRRLFSSSFSALDSMRITADHYSAAGSPDLIDQSLFVSCQSWLVEDLLMKADKMTMANSVELRVPFLDHRLVEWAATVPSSAKIVKERGRFKTKMPLRDFARDRIPAAILARAKQGFPVPVYDWLTTSLAGWSRDLLLGPGALSPQLFNTAELERTHRAGVSIGSVPDQHKLWVLLVLELWLREWQPDT